MRWPGIGAWVPERRASSSTACPPGGSGVHGHAYHLRDRHRYRCRNRARCGPGQAVSRAGRGLPASRPRRRKRCLVWQSASASAGPVGGVLAVGGHLRVERAGEQQIRRRGSGWPASAARRPVGDLDQVPPRRFQVLSRRALAKALGWQEHAGSQRWNSDDQCDQTAHRRHQGQFPAGQRAGQHQQPPQRDDQYDRCGRGAAPAHPSRGF